MKWRREDKSWSPTGAAGSAKTEDCDDDDWLIGKLAQTELVTSQSLLKGISEKISN